MTFYKVKALVQAATRASIAAVAARKPASWQRAQPFGLPSGRELPLRLHGGCLHSQSAEHFQSENALKDGIPQLTFAQKVALADLVFYAAWMLLPSIIGTDNALGAFIKKNSLGGSLVAMTALFMIFKDGKPLFNIQAVNQKFPWAVLVMFAAAILVGGVMVSKDTNVALFLAAVMHKALYGMNFILLTVVVTALAMLATNFLNSIAFGILLTPVLISMCASFGIAASPLMACFIFSVLIAGCLPSGSVYAALMYGNTGHFIA